MLLLTNHIFNLYTKKPLRRSNTKNSKLYFSSDYTIYFLTKEVFYTKLKYSRVPQFDTSAGAAASFLSGLFGFMVCERFGFELLDSGDFLFAVSYLIAIIFLISLLVEIANAYNNWGSDLINFLNSFRYF
uniref:Uncharacterized protein ORF129 n=1 Tax=Euplotes crassus TaxID=5936 RepID=D1LDR6_EUPCR|nr:hypothetical protein [Moneuplotes crassus]